MRDLKKTNQKTKKVRRNRRKQERSPLICAASSAFSASQCRCFQYHDDHYRWIFCRAVIDGF